MLTNDQKKELKKIVDSELKTYKDNELKKYIIDIIRDSMGDLFKTLWTRRSTWEKEIGRK